MAAKKNNFFVENIDKWGEVLQGTNLFKKEAGIYLTDLLKSISPFLEKKKIKIGQIQSTGTSKDNFLNYNAEATIRDMPGLNEKVILVVGVSWDRHPKTEQDLKPFVSVTFKCESVKRSDSFNLFFKNKEKSTKSVLYWEITRGYIWITRHDDVAYRNTVQELTDDFLFIFKTLGFL